LDGLLKAKQLSLLITRPLGVKSVINPEATEGAADPQEMAEARENAPTTVLTLDRVVSQLDYEDFARNFSGIAKALATWTWNEHARGMYLTIAGEEGATISPDSATISSLRESLLEFGNPLVPIQIKSYTAVSFKLSGTVYVDADQDVDVVGTAVNEALKSAFSFEARSFGQPVTLSEVEAVIQNVAGVTYVDLDTLYVGNSSSLQSYLAAQAPRDGAAFDLIEPAELLTLDEDSLSGLEVKTV
jgi:predicted phage baseplate assembly protein